MVGLFHEDEMLAYAIKVNRFCCWKIMGCEVDWKSEQFLAA